MKRKPGAPKGTVNNPLGTNQWEGNRAKSPIAVRLLEEQDRAIRDRAISEGKTLTEVMEEAIALYLSS
ncbi:ribbon-helix-helix protein, CopG family [Merismopedia glauca]|nr:ribbon-helix-helix protein, CopG family [Merismopedia glauca]